MTTSRTYPHGVPSWVDTEQPDLEKAQSFYSALFGWTFAAATPPEAPAQYLIARLEGDDAAGLAEATERPARWNTYLAVEDADQATARVTEAGGRVLVEPADAGEGGRFAICADPSGAVFRLWQAHRRLGALVVNVPGSWNFSDLHTDDPVAAVAFYTEVFGWVVDDLGNAPMIRSPGYGDHLAATVDPDIRKRQEGAGAPPGFEDAIAWVGPAEPGTSNHWHVSFTVADRDATVTTAQELGAEVLSTAETEWTRTALIRDPQGARFTASQFTPPT